MFEGALMIELTLHEETNGLVLSVIACSKKKKEML